MKGKNIYFQEAKLAGLKRSVARAWLLLLAIVALKAGMAQSVTVTTFADLKTHLEAGHDVTLGANIVASYGTITILNTITATLRLNGHDLSYPDGLGGGEIIRVADGATFNLYGNGAIRYTGTSKRTEPPIVVWGNTTVFNMYGGTIRDFLSTSNEGAAVYVLNGACFNMSGGVISGNKTDGRVGAIFISSTASTYSSTLNMTGGTVEYNEANGKWSYGGGIFIEPNSKVRLTDVTIRYNKADEIGAGVYIERDVSDVSGGSPIISGCTFLENKLIGQGSDHSGGAIKSVVPLRITNCTFSNNDATLGGGIEFYPLNQSENLYVEGCTFTGNTASSAMGDGGAIHVSQGTVHVTDSEIRGGSANRGAGMYLAQGVTAVISGGRIDGNSATYGGGFYLEDNSIVTVRDNAIVFDCEATEGGGFYLSSGSELATDGETSNTMSIIGCQAQTLGGGIFIGNGATANISDAQVNDNEAQSGGGIYIYPGGTANLNGCMFEGNEAVRGGGIYNYGILNSSEVRYIGNTASDFGGGLYNCVATYTSDTDLFGNNSAPSGGGIYSEQSNMSATKLTLSINSASYYGGGMYQTGGIITMESECLITGNTAGFNGGGIYLTDDGNLTFNEGDWDHVQSVSHNTANENGGGVYMNNGHLTCSGYVDISENTATLFDGGGIYIGGGTADLLTFANAENRVERNTAGRDGGGICQVAAGSSCMINAGYEMLYILQNTASRNGGGVFVAPNAWFTLSSGDLLVADNDALCAGEGSLGGGGICNNDGVVILASGSTSFSENETSGKGNAMYQGGHCWIAGSIQASLEQYFGPSQYIYLLKNRYFTKKGIISSSSKIGVEVDDAFHTRDILLSWSGSSGDADGQVVLDDAALFDLTNNYGHLGAVYEEDGQDDDYENYAPGDVIEVFWTWVDAVTEKPDSFVVTTTDGQEHVDISTADELAWLISYVNGFNGETPHPFVNASIKADIDMRRWVWESIGQRHSIEGDSYSGKAGYMGCIDGEGHFVTGLYNRSDIGLSGFVDMLGVEMTGIWGGGLPSGFPYGRQPEIRHLFVGSNFNGGFRYNCNGQKGGGPVPPPIKDGPGAIGHIGILANEVRGGSILESEAFGNISCVTLAGCLSSETAQVGGICGLLTNGLFDDEDHRGQVVSSMAMADIEAYNTIGGLVGYMSGHTLLVNSFSNVGIKYLGSTAYGGRLGGLVGYADAYDNKSVVENCYSRLHSLSTPEDDARKLFGKLMGGGNAKYCYAADNLPELDYTGYMFSPYMGWYQSSDILTGHGTYSPTQTPYLYQHDDNNVTLAPASGSNPYYSSDESSLLHTLNAYAADKGYTSWMRTTAGTGNSGNINDDYPVLKISRFNTVGSQDGRVLRYGDFGDLIGLYNDVTDGGSLCLYAAADLTDRPGLTNDSDVTLYIMEDAPLNHNSAGMTAYVGITLDNSAGTLGANPNGLTANGITDAIDWHMFSTPLINAPLGVNYQGNSTQYNYWVGDDIPDFGFYPESIQNGYFPSKSYGTNGLDGTDYYHDWDYYCFYEPDYHWINFKRNTPSHWHEDEPHNWIDYTNETSLTQGKGYLLATKEDCFLQSFGTLANGQVNITATRQGAHCTGYNLLGNPYPCYLDFKAFAEANSGPGKIWNDVSTASYILLDEDKQGYVTYTYDMSSNPMSASRYINMHQGFFIVAENEASAVFDNSMRSVKSYGEGFRGEDEEPAYPLVNLIVTEENGNKTYTVVELDRPEKGGSLWATDLRVGNAKMCAHYDDECYSVVFAQPGVTSMPIWFESKSDAQYTMSWNTQNGTFGYLHLIDNITGADIDCLADSCYVFQASANDYKSRFKLKFEYTGIDEEQQEHVTDFAFMKDGQLVVTGSGHLELMDLNGRVLYASELVSAQSMLALPSVASGLYLLRLANAYGCMTQKIIIK